MDRRLFLKILSTTAAAAGFGQVGNANAGGARASETFHPHVVPANLSPGEKAYIFLTQPEIDFLEAAVARIIPADDLGLGALEADVVAFLDGQLAGAYGSGARTYMQGPWGDSTAFQGYQLPVPPAAVYRIGIAATDRYCEETHGGRFADLTPELQDAVLTGLQGVAEAIDLKDIPAAVFFNLLVRDTKDGFFSDPVYGGNRDKVGWNLVGYPGAAAVYNDQIFQQNVPYQVTPVSIRDLQEARVPMDHHGHPIHQHAKAEDVSKTRAPELRAGMDRVQVAVIDPYVRGDPVC